jgi:hypothetical protein
MVLQSMPIPITSLAHTQLTGVTTSQHHTLYTDAEALAAAIAGVAVVEIGAAEASDSATLAVAGIDTTLFDFLMVMVAAIVPESDNQTLGLQMGDASGFDVGAADYGWIHSRYFSENYDASGSYIYLGTGVGGAAGGGFSGTYFMNNDGSSMNNPLFGAAITNRLDNTEGSLSAGQRLAPITLTQIRLRFNSGNVKSGWLGVYGIRHA